MRLDRFRNPEFRRGRSAPVELLWIAVQALAVSSALPGSAHRRWLLRAFGAAIGEGVVLKPRLRVKFPWKLTVGHHAWIGEGVWIDNLAPVRIGDQCCLSQGAYLCTGNHDWSRETFDLIEGPIHVGEGAWIAARAVVGPGVTVGAGAILALGAVATRDVPADWICAGNPARPLRQRPTTPEAGTA